MSCNLPTNSTVYLNIHNYGKTDFISSQLQQDVELRARAGFAGGGIRPETIANDTFSTDDDQGQPVGSVVRKFDINSTSGTTTRQYNIEPGQIISSRVPATSGRITGTVSFSSINKGEYKVWLSRTPSNNTTIGDPAGIPDDRSAYLINVASGEIDFETEGQLTLGGYGGSPKYTVGIQEWFINVALADGHAHSKTIRRVVRFD